MTEDTVIELAKQAKVKPLLYDGKWAVENLDVFAALVAAHERHQWVGLTDEEVSKIIDDEIGFNSCWGPEEQFARAIEAKLKEKNNG